METISNKPKKIHNLMLENRKKMQLSGVEEVLSFAEEAVALALSDGTVTINGRDLKITKFSAEEGILGLEGFVDVIRYSNSAEKRGLFKRLLK